MLSIFKKELQAYFNSLVAYIVIAIFVTGIGLFMWVFGDYTIFKMSEADMGTLFQFTPYFFMFLIPAVSMRLFAEEKKTGTMELLFTKPISDWHIILGKYLASLLLVTVAILLTLTYYFSLRYLADGNIDTAGITGAYLGLILLGAAYLGFGVFASSLTDNQIISFVIAVVLCFMYYEGVYQIGNVFNNHYIIAASAGHHYMSLGMGMIDSRNVLYLICSILLTLSATKLKLDSRNW